jgi:hypothetical protein
MDAFRGEMTTLSVVRIEKPFVYAHSFPNRVEVEAVYKVGIMSVPDQMPSVSLKLRTAEELPRQ